LRHSISGSLFGFSHARQLLFASLGGGRYETGLFEELIMSADQVEHQATVEKGLRMKIKRKTPASSSVAVTTGGATGKSSAASASNATDTKGGKASAAVGDEAGVSPKPVRRGAGWNGVAAETPTNEIATTGRHRSASRSNSRPATVSCSATGSADERPKKKGGSGGGSAGSSNSRSSNNGGSKARDKADTSAADRKDQSGKKNVQWSVEVERYRAA
jgi:hypothetical protein